LAFLAPWRFISGLINVIGALAAVRVEVNAAELGAALRRGAAAEVEAHVGELGAVVVYLAELGHVAGKELEAELGGGGRGVYLSWATVVRGGHDR
jgi:hypothetical protein